MRAFGVYSSLAIFATVTLASPAPAPDAIPEPVAEPQLPVSLPIPVPGGALPTSLPIPLPGGALPTSLPVPLPGGALPTSLPILLPSGALPTESLPVSAPTGLPSLPNLPVGGGAGVGGSINGVPIPGLTTNPNNLLNNVAEAVQILQYIASLIQTLQNTGTISIPGIVGIGIGVQGAYISALLGLAKGLLPVS